MSVPTDHTTWSVGRLAAGSGLTVRTLHHWDAIGLVVPSERSAAGHRRYTDADVRRIYRVVALRGLGLGLAQVRQMLGGDGDVRAAVREHLAELDRRIAAEQALRDRVAALLDAFDAAREPSTAQFIQTIEEMTMHEQYYTPEQLQQLEQRRQSLGPDGMERAQQAWAELLAEARAEMERGTDPADERVQALAARWQALVEQFTGGDPGIAASLKRMYDEQGPQAASRGMVDPELMAYIGRARAAG